MRPFRLSSWYLYYIGFQTIITCLFDQVDRNSNQLNTNAQSVLNEIEEMYQRLSNVLRERTEFLKSSVDKYLTVESKNLKDVKESLELELANIKVSFKMFKSF